MRKASLREGSGASQHTILPPLPAPTAFLALEQSLASLETVPPVQFLAAIVDTICCSSSGRHCASSSRWRIVLIEGYRKGNRGTLNILSKRGDSYGAQSNCSLLSPCLNVDGLRQRCLHGAGGGIADSHCGGEEVVEMLRWEAQKARAEEQQEGISCTNTTRLLPAKY